MQGGRDGCRVLVGKPEFGSPLGTLRRVWEDGFKVGLKETVGLWDVLDCIRLAEGGEKWWAIVSSVMNLGVL
jgi:hypothetical protein